MENYQDHIHYNPSCFIYIDAWPNILPSRRYVSGTLPSEKSPGTKRRKNTDCAVAGGI